MSGGDEGLNTSVDSSTVTVGLLVIESLIAELTNSVPALRGDFLVSALLALDPNGSFNWDIRKGIEHPYIAWRRQAPSEGAPSRCIRVRTA